MIDQQHLHEVSYAGSLFRCLSHTSDHLLVDIGFFFRNERSESYNFLKQRIKTRQPLYNLVDATNTEPICGLCQLRLQVAEQKYQNEV
jgi:hypothetical protein